MTPTVLFVRKNDRHERMQVQDILYLAAAGSYLIIKTKNDEVTLSQNLTHFIHKNPIPSLLRVHRSFIVNLERIESFDHHFIYIDTHQIPLEDSYREKFMKEINCI